MLLQEQNTSMTRRIPPHVFFFVSAVFHYLGHRLPCCFSPAPRCLASPGFALPAPLSCLPSGDGPGVSSSRCPEPGNAPCWCLVWSLA